MATKPPTSFGAWSAWDVVGMIMTMATMASYTQKTGCFCKDPGAFRAKSGYRRELVSENSPCKIWQFSKSLNRVAEKWGPSCSLSWAQSSLKWCSKGRNQWLEVFLHSWYLPNLLEGPLDQWNPILLVWALRCFESESLPKGNLRPISGHRLHRLYALHLECLRFLSIWCWLPDQTSFMMWAMRWPCR